VTVTVIDVILLTATLKESFTGFVKSAYSEHKIVMISILLIGEMFRSTVAGQPSIPYLSFIKKEFSEEEHFIFLCVIHTLDECCDITIFCNFILVSIIQFNVVSVLLFSLPEL
jgi:hypothetical protein